MEEGSMKRILMVAILMLGLLAFMSCAANNATAPEQKKPVGWGTIDTIESETVK
jgi:hypothetical protein